MAMRYYLCMLGNFCCCLQIFFKVTFFNIFFQEYHQCQPAWTQIFPDILLGLIWVQTGCKDYEETTLSGSQLKITFNSQKLKSLVLTIRTSVESPNPSCNTTIYSMGLDGRKPVFKGLRTTKVQPSLRIHAV